MSEQAKKPSFFAKLSRWGRELKSETKKIVWPSQSQVLNNTLVVISSILMVGVLVWGVDTVFHLLRDLLIKMA